MVKNMGDTTIKKIDSSHSPKGQDGQIYLASGHALSMRLWKEEPVSKEMQESEKDYETVGYVIQGRAELHSEGQLILLEPGDSWLVPRGAKHHYQIVEPFTAIEATSPPAPGHDQQPAGQPAGEKETQANPTTQQQEEKARRDQEIVAQIPRTSKNITSNAPEKKPEPSKHVDVGPKENTKKENTK